MGQKRCQVAWTALPNGIADGAGTLKISVLVSPRLMDTPPTSQRLTLAQFPNWLDWPAILASLRFRVKIDNVARPITSVGSSARSEMWRALFPPSTFVRSYIYDDKLREFASIISNPVADIAGYVTSAYAAYAAGALSGLPTTFENAIQALDAGLITFTPEQRRALDGFDAAGAHRQPPNDDTALEMKLSAAMKDERNRKRTDAGSVLRQFSSSRTVPVGRPASLGAALDHLVAFHRTYHQTSRRPEDSPPDIAPDAEALRKEIDFHQVTSSLAQYPVVARAAGLVIDLEIRRSSISNGPHVMELEVEWPANGSPAPVEMQPDLRPPINVMLSPRTFEARPGPADTELTGRWLKLRNSAHHLVDVNTDDAGFKFEGFLRGLETNISLVAKGTRGFYESTVSDLDFEPRMDVAGVPSLSTGGLIVTRDAHADVLVSRLKRSNAIESAASNQTQGGTNAMPALNAGDTVRGYRVDVFDSVIGAWFSLCRRDGTYTLPRNAPLSFATTDEEGMVGMSVSSFPDANNNKSARISDELFSWKGWSLCAPKPGTAVFPWDTRPEAAPNVAQPADLELTTKFSVTPGTLPTLRFGRTYKMRVRLVDLAGNSVAFAGTDVQPSDAASELRLYPRYEPVGSPDVALVQSAADIELPGDGENAGLLAIRSFNDTTDLNTVPTTQQARRYLLPPRVELEFAELQGVMDTDNRLDPARLQMVADFLAQGHLRSKNQLSTVEVSRRGGAPTTDETLTKYATFTDDGEIPYLPDAWAVAAAIKVDIVSESPSVADFVKLMSGASGVPLRRAVPQVSPLELPPQSAPTKPAGATKFLRDMYFVPFYDVNDFRLVPSDWPHAKPFKIVAVDQPATDVYFDAGTREFRVPLEKGQRIVLYVSSLIPKEAIPKMAAWWRFSANLMDPPRDYAEMTLKGRNFLGTPWRRIELVHAVQRPLVTPSLDISCPRPLYSNTAPLEIATQVDGPSTVTLDLFGSWQEALDDLAADAPEVRPIVDDHPQEFTVMRKQDRSAALKLNGRHNFRDTRYRRVMYRLDANSRFTEFMPASIRSQKDKLKVSSAPARVWVPNAAPPPTPKVLYVVPTFGWKRNNGQSIRCGCGLRAYLERPWFTSGYGEMLAVVLPPAFERSLELSKRYASNTTHWGSDPIWFSGKIGTSAPEPRAFSAAKWKGPLEYPNFPGVAADDRSDWPAEFPVTNLPLPPPPGLDAAPVAGTPLPVDVAPHIVGYDQDRKLWYADIEVAPPQDAYYPFIRLALARYHPVSVAGAHLSNVALTEFQQLVPDRLAIVSKDPTSRLASVQVYGVLATDGPLSPKAGLFSAEVQVLESGGDPDLDWKTVDIASGTGIAAPGFNIVRQRGQRPLWRGNVRLPVPPPGASLRLLITESESYRTSEFPRSPQGRRIVYLETMQL